MTHGTPTALTPQLMALMTAANLAPEWFNYRLDGVQTGYFQPKLLGNSVIEGENAEVPLTQASCITCHSVSSVKNDGTDGITLLTSNPSGLRRRCHRALGSCATLFGRSPRRASKVRSSHARALEQKARRHTRRYSASRWTAAILTRIAAGFREMVETAAIVAKPHRVRAQFDDEIMQFRGRHERLDVVPAGPARPLGIAEDLAAAA